MIIARVGAPDWSSTDIPSRGSRRRETVDVVGLRPSGNAERTVVERARLFTVGDADGDVVDHFAGEAPRASGEEEPEAEADDEHGQDDGRHHDPPVAVAFAIHALD